MELAVVDEEGRVDVGLCDKVAEVRRCDVVRVVGVLVLVLVLVVRVKVPAIKDVLQLFHRAE